MLPMKKSITIAICLIVTLAGCQHVSPSVPWFETAAPSTPEPVSDELMALTVAPEFSHDIAYQYLETKIDRDTAYSILRETEVYAFTEIGEYITAPQITSYFLLLKQPDARAIFESLNSEAKSPGKIYAFHALRSLSESNETTTLAELMKNESSVLVHQCCLQHPALISINDLGNTKPWSE